MRGFYFGSFSAVAEKTAAERAGELDDPIKIEKFSAKTYPRDVMKTEMPKEMRDALHSGNVGRVWRVKIGMKYRWWYGWSLEEAIGKALGGDQR